VFLTKTAKSQFVLQNSDLSPAPSALPLKAISRSDSSLNYEDLDDSLTRLRDGRAVIEWEIKGRELSFNGGLIAYYERDKTNKLYKITFAPTS
jgi:hypothetical protein